MTASTITARSTPEPLRVIVAEDDPDAREVLGDIARSLGHSCQVAGDRSDASAMHQANRAEVIISDWKMPIVDGLALSREVRESEPIQWHTHSCKTGIRQTNIQLAATGVPLQCNYQTVKRAAKTR